MTRPAGLPAATELFCLAYGHLAGLTRADLLYGVGHDAPMPPIPLNIFVIRAGGAVVLVDAGAAPDWAARKGVLDYVDPVSLLACLGIRPEQVDHLVLTHLHWDHATHLDAYPRARVHVQRAELDGWRAALTWGEDLAWVFRGRVEASLLAALDRLDANGRLAIWEGDDSVCAGVDVFLAPGHTFGTQVVGVTTEAGRFVLASDAVYLYENVERMVPLGNGLDQVAQLRSFVRARDLAGPGLLVPGHDPSLGDRFPRVDERILRLL